MLSDHLEFCHSYWMSKKTKYLGSMELPYYRGLKEIIWIDYCVPLLKEKETMWDNRNLMGLSFEKKSELEFYLELTTNSLITVERSIQIYLDPKDPLHQKQYDRRKWDSVLTRAKREYQISVLFE